MPENNGKDDVSKPRDLMAFLTSKNAAQAEAAERAFDEGLMPPPPVIDAKLPQELCDSIWLAMAASTAQQPHFREAAPEMIGHSPMESDYANDEVCPSCGTTHHTYVMSFFAKTEEEVRLMREAVKVAAVQIMRDRGGQEVS